MDPIAWTASRLLDGLSYLPYFKGKGLLALWIVRICGRNYSACLPGLSSRWRKGEKGGGGRLRRLPTPRPYTLPLPPR